ncbi:DUF6221 family protein [Streptomyces sp. NPDC001070]
MSDDLTEFPWRRIDEDAEPAGRCDGDGRGVWTAHGHTVDFCQVDLSGFHPAIAEHAASRDPARALEEVAAKRRVLARHVLSPAAGDPELPWDNRDDCRWDGESRESGCPTKSGKKRRATGGCR